MSIEPVNSEQETNNGVDEEQGDNDLIVNTKLNEKYNVK